MERHKSCGRWRSTTGGGSRRPSELADLARICLIPSEFGELGAIQRTGHRQRSAANVFFAERRGKNYRALYSDLFRRDIQGMIRGLAPGKRGGFKAFWAWCTSGEYRRARREALRYRVAGKVRDSELFVEITAAEDERVKWTAMSKGSSLPQLLDDYINGQREPN